MSAAKDIICLFPRADLGARPEDYPEDMGIAVLVPFADPEQMHTLPWHAEEGYDSLISRYTEHLGKAPDMPIFYEGGGRHELPGALYNAIIAGNFGHLRNEEFIEAALDHKVNFEFEREAEQKRLEAQRLAEEEVARAAMMESPFGAEAEPVDFTAEAPAFISADDYDGRISNAWLERSLDGQVYLHAGSLEGLDSASSCTVQINIETGVLCIDRRLVQDETLGILCIPSHVTALANSDGPARQPVMLLQENERWLVVPQGRVEALHAINEETPVEQSDFHSGKPGSLVIVAIATILMITVFLVLTDFSVGLATQARELLQEEPKTSAFERLEAEKSSQVEE